MDCLVLTPVRIRWTILLTAACLHQGILILNILSVMNCIFFWMGEGPYEYSRNDIVLYFDSFFQKICFRVKKFEKDPCEKANFFVNIGHIKKVLPFLRDKNPKKL